MTLGLLQSEKEEDIVFFTEKAVNALRENIENDPEAVGQFIRCAVAGGGCAGFQYSMEFEKTQREDDFIIDLGNNIKILIDPISSMYLEGTKIDFVVEKFTSGFKFVNPSVKTTCGCGSSFSV